MYDMQSDNKGERAVVKELRNLRKGLKDHSKYFTALPMFVGGMLRGAGIIVGATLLVLLGGTLLGLLGLLPGLEDIVATILDAFERARLQ